MGKETIVVDTFASDTKLSSPVSFFFFFENNRSATVKGESLESDLSKERGFGIFKKGQGPSKFNIASLTIEPWKRDVFVTLQTFSSTNLFCVVERIFSRASKEGCFSSSIQSRYPNNARSLSLFITAKYHTPRIELSPISCLFIWKVERRRSKRKGGNCTHHKRPDSSPACFFSRGSCSSVDGNSWCRSRCRSRRQARKSKGNP